MRKSDHAESEVPAVGVFLDTNQWVTSLLLRSATGAALVHMIARSGGRILLPEAIEGEIEEVIKRRVDEAMAAVVRGRRELQAIAGSVEEWKPPDRIATAVRDRFDQLGVLLERRPLLHEHTLAAIDRVNRKVSPTSGNREEFRDHLVWQSVLEKARDGGPVVLVTNDGDFFGTANGHDLAKALADDIAELDVRVVRSLDGCLALLKEEFAPNLNRQHLITALANSIATEVEATAEKGGVRVGGCSATQLSLYATEDPRRVAVLFELEFATVGEEPNAIVVFAEGEAFFNFESGDTETRLKRYGRRRLTADGGVEVEGGTTVLALGSIVLGVRDEPWEARTLLE
jgi:hypothetical protein